MADGACASAARRREEGSREAANPGASRIGRSWRLASAEAGACRALSGAHHAARAAGRRLPTRLQSRGDHQVCVAGRASTLRDARRTLFDSRTHLHLIVEAEGAKALSQAMRGRATRIARRLNGLTGRCGRVFVDRYHAQALKSPRQVANARRCVLENYRHHTREYLGPHWRDPLSTAAASLLAPSTWLLSAGWRLAAP
jgi:hypothetical protein